jgi:Zn-dependent protease with chaperone function
VIWAAAVPLLIGLALVPAAGSLERQLMPSAAVRLLTALALTVALSTGLVLSAAAVLVCVQLGPFPREGGWSVHTLRTGMGFPVIGGVVALGIVMYLLTAAITRAARSVCSLRAAGRSVRDLEPVIGDLVLVEDAVPVAYAVAGRPGRIVISTSMLAALSAAERRVVIAHEASHLRHRHHLYAHLGDVAAAANPLLRPTASAIKRAVERWADEDAAVVVGDRALTGRALARAALASAGRPAGRRGMAVAEDHVAERVARLFAPPIRRRPWLVVMVLVAALISWAAAAAVTNWANNLVQLAESVYQRR